MAELDEAKSAGKADAEECGSAAQNASSQHASAQNAGQGKRSVQGGHASRTRQAAQTRQPAQTRHVSPETSRNFLLDYNRMLEAFEHDYVDCARFISSGYSEFIGKLYTINPAMFQNRAYCDRTLTQTMLHYLSWFQDPAIKVLVGPGAAWHVFPMMRAQRLGDSLYVTAVGKEAPLAVGDRIVGVNGSTLDEIRPEIERTLRTTVDPADPEREDWSIVLAFARSLTVRDEDGGERVVQVVPGDSEGARRERAMQRIQAHAQIEGEDISRAEVVRRANEIVAKQDAERAATAACGTAADAAGATLGMSDAFELARAVGVADGGEAAASASAIELSPASEEGVEVLTVRRPDDPHFAELAREAAMRLSDFDALRGLVIDVRGAAGGAMEAAYPLIPLLLSPGTETTVRDLFGEGGIVMNCSRNNVKERVDQLDAMHAQIASSGSPSELAQIDGLREELSTKLGAGLVRDNTDYFVPASFASAFFCDRSRNSFGVPRVVVLADRYTADAAEWLVRAARAAAIRGLSCATVMGRATAGSLDNTSPRIVRLDSDFAVAFPTAKYAFAQDGAGTLGRGIAPDVHLAWTPEQIDRDMELEAALRRASGR